MNRKISVFLCVFLGALFLVFCACGRREEESYVPYDLAVENAEWGYALERALELPWEEDACSELCCLENIIYYLRTDFLFDGESVKEAWSEEFLRELEQDPELKKRISVRSRVARRELLADGMGEETILFETDAYVERILPVASGGFYLITAPLQDVLNYREDRELVRVDKAGKVLFQKDVSSFYQPGPSAVDGQGNLAFWANGVVTCLNGKGVRVREQRLQGFALGLCGKPEGGFLASVNGEKGIEFLGISLQKGGSAESFTGAGDAGEAIYGKDGKLFLGGGSAIYEGSPDDGICKRLFRWTELGILQYDVNLWWPLDGEHLGVILGGEGDAKSVLLLKRIPRENVAEKETVILGSWGSVGSDLEKAIASFNRGNPDYQVKVLDYAEKLNPSSTREDWQNAKDHMEQDVLFQGTVDLLVGTSLELSKYDAKEVFEDLTPYLGRSEKLSAEDFFPEVLEASRRQGKLLLLPKGFSLQTLVCKKKVLEQTLGKGAFDGEILKETATWDVDRYMAAVDHFPDAEVTQYSVTYERDGLTGRAGAAVELALLLNQDYFANEASRQCRFDGELFAELLAFGARRGKIQASASSYGEAFEGDKWLFCRTELAGFSGVQNARILFGREEICFAGFPAQQGEGHHLLSPAHGLLMMAGSAHKEGAWEFLEHYLLAGEGDGEDYFPARKERFAERAQALSQSMAQDAALVEKMLYASVSAKQRMEAQIIQIIDEEAQAVFQGQKRAEDVAKVIQSRVSLYLNEK